MWSKGMTILSGSKTRSDPISPKALMARTLVPSWDMA